jgi:coproporphyrinogen III oxidase-like Fe-S oxidoreductase
MNQRALEAGARARQEFLAALLRWQGVASSKELGPQTSQVENSARQTCKRRGWVTFDKFYWRITDDGRAAYRAMLSAATTGENDAPKAEG